MKKKYIYGRYYCSGFDQTWEDYMAHLSEWEKGRKIRYWKAFSLSGPRQYAREQTNRKIRRESRFSVYPADEYDIYEDAYVMNHSGYRKKFDYAGTVWW